MPYRTAPRSVLTGFMVMMLAGSASAQPHAVVQHDRPAALMPLYVAFAGLQALDAHSTLAALRGGARESNPLIRSALGTPAGLALLKGGAAAGVVFLNERLWPHNRTAAVLTMVALNSAYATIAAHNYRTRGRR
jgi:hypothetical protein